MRQNWPVWKHSAPNMHPLEVQCAHRKHCYLQGPRKGGFSKGGFCRVQCHGQGNQKCPRILGPAVHLAPRAPQSQARRTFLQNPPSKNSLRLVLDTSKRAVSRYLFYLQLKLLCIQLSFFAYSPLRPLLDALSHCKQKSSNCKQKS